MGIKRIHWAVFNAIFLLAGCAKIQVQQERRAATGIQVYEKISFILDRSAIKDVKDAERIEKKIEACVGRSLKKLDPPVATVSAKSFRDAAFPSVNYFSVPSSPDSLLALLKVPKFRERIAPLGIRYLLVLRSEFASKADTIGGCLGGPGGAGCLVFLVWDNETKMSACVLDIAAGCNAGEVKAQAMAHPWLGIVLFFPVGFPAFSEGPACDALGKGVAKFIAGSRDRAKQTQ